MKDENIHFNFKLISFMVRRRTDHIAAFCEFIMATLDQIGRRAGLLLLLGLLSCAGAKPADQPSCAIELTYQGQARSVCVSGDFNQWSPQSHCMQAGQKSWHLTLSLPAGKHRYLFVVDGRRWVCDPNALYQEEDGFGRKNSVLLVE